MEFPSKSENPIRTHGRNGAWKMSSPKKFMRTKGFRRLQTYTNMIVNACPKNTRLTNKPKIWRTVKESITVFTTRKGFAMQKEAKQSILKRRESTGGSVGGAFESYLGRKGRESSLVNMSGDLMVYETQFFGFTPQTFMLRIYMAFQDHLSHIVLIAEEAMLNKLRNAHRNVTPSLIRRGTEQFFSFMKERFENLFGQMEETLLNTVLRIPKNVLLPEDKGQETFRYTAEQFQQLQDEIRQQEQQLQAETQAGWALQAELEEQKLVQGHLEKILQWMEGLDKASREGGTGSLQENFLAMTKTTAKLQSVVQEVEEKSKKLGGKL